MSSSGDDLRSALQRLLPDDTNVLVHEDEVGVIVVAFPEGRRPEGGVAMVRWNWDTLAGLIAPKLLGDGELT
jgi:hypothetical protein